MSFLRTTICTAFAALAAALPAWGQTPLDPTFCAVYSPQAAQVWMGGWGSCWNPSPPPLPPHPAFLHTWFVPETFVSVFQREQASHFATWPVPQEQIAHTPLVAAAVNSLFGVNDGEALDPNPTTYQDPNGNGGRILQAHVGPVFFSGHAASNIPPWNTSAGPVRGAETCINYSTRMDSYQWKTGALDQTFANPTFDLLLAFSAPAAAAVLATPSQLNGYTCTQTTIQTTALDIVVPAPIPGLECHPNPIQYVTQVEQQGFNCSSTVDYFHIEYHYYIDGLYGWSSGVFHSDTDITRGPGAACQVQFSWGNGPWCEMDQVTDPDGNPLYNPDGSPQMTESCWGDNVAYGSQVYGGFPSKITGQWCPTGYNGSARWVDLGTACSPNMVQVQVPLPQTYTCHEVIQTPVTTTFHSGSGGSGCMPDYRSPDAAIGAGLLAASPAMLCASFGIPISPPNPVPFLAISPYDPTFNVHMVGPIAVGGPGCKASVNAIPTITPSLNCYDTHFIFPRRGETREGDLSIAAAITAIKALNLSANTAGTIDWMPGDFLCTASTGLCFPWGTPSQVIGRAAWQPDSGGLSRWGFVVWRMRGNCLDYPTFPFVTDAAIAAFCSATQPALMSAELARQSAVYAFP